MTSREIFLRYNAQTSPFPMLLEVEKAEGSFIIDSQGNKLLDMIAGIAVSNVGHRHPKVVSAIEEQVKKYLHVMVYGEFVQQPQILLAKALCETVNDKLDNVYLTNSGAEAIDGAMKIAKKFTGKHKFISCFNAYHGSLQGPLSLMGNDYFKKGYEPLLPDCDRIRFGVEEDLELIDKQTCAVFIETIQGEAGVKLASKHYWNQLLQRCRETETLLVLDEIQVGFGRTGYFWAFEAYDFVPDILVCSKGMGGGMPIGAVLTRKEIMQVISHDPILGHITTFGGHPVSCAAALATLKIILEENLCFNVKQRNQQFNKNLKHPLIKEIRHAGLLIAIELDNFSRVEKTIKNCLKFGLISDWFLFCNHSIRLAPPLNLSENEADLAIEILIKALDHL